VVHDDRGRPPFGEAGVSYSVRWTRRALDAVAQAWLDNSIDRSAITEDVVTADEVLAIDPSSHGESREENRRVVFLNALVLTIQVENGRRVVSVLNVRHRKRRDIP
jgi:hypothetical protein